MNELGIVPLSNKLIEQDRKTFGDYIHGGSDSYGVIEKIMELKKKYK